MTNELEALLEEHLVPDVEISFSHQLPQEVCDMMFDVDGHYLALSLDNRTFFNVLTGEAEFNLPVEVARTINKVDDRHIVQEGHSHHSKKNFLDLETGKKVFELPERVSSETHFFNGVHHAFGFTGNVYDIKTGKKIMKFSERVMPVEGADDLLLGWNKKAFYGLKEGIIGYKVYTTHLSASPAILNYNGKKVIFCRGKNEPFRVVELDTAKDVQIFSNYLRPKIYTSAGKDFARIEHGSRFYDLETGKCLLDLKDTKLKGNQNLHQIGDNSYFFMGDDNRSVYDFKFVPAVNCRLDKLSELVEAKRE